MLRCLILFSLLLIINPLESYCQNYWKEMTLDQTVFDSESTGLFLYADQNNSYVLQFPRDLKFNKRSDVNMIRYDSLFNYMGHVPFPGFNDKQGEIVHIEPLDSSVYVFYSIQQKGSDPTTFTNKVEYFKWNFLNGELLIEPNVFVEWDGTEGERPLNIVISKNGDDTFYGTITFPDRTIFAGTGSGKKEIAYSGKGIDEIIDVKRGPKTAFVYKRKIGENNIKYGVSFINDFGDSKYYILPFSKYRIQSIRILPESNSEVVTLLAMAYEGDSYIVSRRDKPLLVLLKVTSSGKVISKKLLQFPDPLQAELEAYRNNVLKELSLISGVKNNEGEYYLVLDSRSENHCNLLNDFSDLRSKEESSAWCFNKSYLRPENRSGSGAQSSIGVGPTIVVKVDSEFSGVIWSQEVRGYLRTEGDWELTHANASLDTDGVRFTFLSSAFEKHAKQFIYNSDVPVNFKEVLIDYDGYRYQKVLFRSVKPEEPDVFRLNTISNLNNRYYMLGEKGGVLYLFQSEVTN